MSTCFGKKKVVHAREIERSPPFIPLEASEGDEGEQSGAKRKIGDKLSLMQIKKDFASSRQSHQQHNDYLDSLLRPVNPRAVRIDPWVSPRLALPCLALLILHAFLPFAKYSPPSPIFIPSGGAEHAEGEQGRHLCGPRAAYGLCPGPQAPLRSHHSRTRPT